MKCNECWKEFDEKDLIEYPLRTCSKICKDCFIKVSQNIFEDFEKFVTKYVKNIDFC